MTSKTTETLIRQANMGNGESILLWKVEGPMMRPGQRTWTQGVFFELGHSYRGRHVMTARFDTETEARKAANRLWSNKMAGFGWVLDC